MTRGPRKSIRWAAALAGMVASLAVVAPAQAATPATGVAERASDSVVLGDGTEVRRYRNVRYGGCIEPYAIQANVDAWTGSCQPSDIDKWLVYRRGTSPSGKPLFQLQSDFSSHCLDSAARNAGGVVRVGSCNGGAYQLWERHDVGTNVVLKSWGAWTLQTRHLCLRASAANATLKLATCATGNTDQQWRY